MDTNLSISLTSDQKALIHQATANEPERKAEWARGILLRAARKRISERGTRQARKTNENAAGRGGWAAQMNGSCATDAPASGPVRRHSVPCWGVFARTVLTPRLSERDGQHF